MFNEDDLRVCVSCGERATDFVMLVWKEPSGKIQHRAYCASWVSPPCWNAYEIAAHLLGY